MNLFKLFIKTHSFLPLQITVLENSSQLDTLKEAVIRITELHTSSALVWFSRLSHGVLNDAAYEDVMVMFKQACAQVDPDVSF